MVVRDGPMCPTGCVATYEPWGVCAWRWLSLNLLLNPASSQVVMVHRQVLTPNELTLATWSWSVPQPNLLHILPTRRQHVLGFVQNDRTLTGHLRSQNSPMLPTWSVSCRQHVADMLMCLLFWRKKIPDTTPTLPAKEEGRGRGRCPCRNRTTP